MGQSANDILDEYDEEGLADSRRIRATDYVRKWLFNSASPNSRSKKPR